ncbi:MAG: radical SAM protein [Candidatus Omnitrophica bacterium]|nr:radical SAM protein [Candidatus Omnitrophota bacterium]
MIKVLFLNPPYFPRFSREQRSPAVTRSGTLYYPMWLAYAAGVLQEEGYQIDFIDGPAEGYRLKEVIIKSKKFAPQLLVLDTSTPSIYNDIEVGAKLKEFLPQAKVVLVGTHVSALPEETLKLCEKIDAIARREYDYTIRDLAYAVERNENWEKILGISYRSGEEILHNPDRPFINNLGEIPFVSKIYKQFLKSRNYFNPNALYPMVTIVAGRGCPFGCSFCVYPQTFSGDRYRYRSPEDIVEEFRYIEKEFPEAKAVFFEDDTLTADRKRCRELMSLMQKSSIKMSWSANSRADVDYETLKQMKAAGCRCLCVGFEAGDEEVLKKMRKGITPEKAHQFMKDAKRAGILVHGCFIFGNPGETKKSLKKTLKFALKLAPDTAQFYPLMVYPGTRAYQWAKEKGYLTTNDYSRWLDLRGQHTCILSTRQLSSQELIDFCRKSRKTFYLRPAYILAKLWQMIRHPQEISRILKALKTFSKYLFKDIICKR